MRNFKQLIVWQKGIELTTAVYAVVENFPREERYALRSQMTRAAVSIPSNIAEGSSRRSEADYRRFLEIALGSSFELETQLLIAERVGLIRSDALIHCLSLVEEEQRMSQSLIHRLSGN